MQISDLFRSLLWSLRRLSPEMLFLISYLGFGALGTVLLMMPWATAQGTMAWEDALFTATSALCVTGLTVADTGSFFSLAGQTIILALIEIGGIGIMTFAVFIFLSSGWRISARQQTFIQETYTSDLRQDIKKLVFFIFAFTTLCEAIGTLLLMVSWNQDLTFFQRLYCSLFHSVSAFCNAGFSLYPDSLVGYSGDVLVNMTITGLILLGGLGFPVVYELWYWWKTPRRYTLSLHSRLVLLFSVILTLAGMAAFWAVERDNVLATMSFPHQLLVSYFQSVTPRTAGFNTIDFSILHSATLMIVIVLMFIGASPGSTGGGIKTTSMAVFFIVLWNRLRGSDHNNVFYRTIPDAAVSRVISIFIISVLYVSITWGLMLVSQTDNLASGSSRADFIECLFETVSAFGTVGLSMGTTPKLDVIGKLLLTATMFVGRVGILTLTYLLISRRQEGTFQYAEENVMTG